MGGFLTTMHASVCFLELCRKEGPIEDGRIPYDNARISVLP